MVSEYLLELTAKNYEFDKSAYRQLEEVRENNKSLYLCEKNGNKYVVSFIECTNDYIYKKRAELDWLSYLADNNANVPTPLRNKSGDLTFSV